MSCRPTPLTELPEELAAMGLKARGDIGLLPNSVLTLAKRPELARGVMGLAGFLASPNCLIEEDLRMMVAYMSSYGAGCTYCQAHTSYVASRGVSEAKIGELWRYDTSELFDERERAALSFAFAAGQVPNAVEEAHYDALGKYFTENEIIDLVGVIAIMGFFNRWNDTMGTRLEPAPAAKAEAVLRESGWRIGRHG